MVYLDYAATSAASDKAMQTYLEMNRSFWGNSSSLHGFGLLAQRKLEEARQTVARSIGAEPDEIIFTSGGTESDNIAILGATHGGRGRIVTTGYEHAAVFEACKGAGVEVVAVPLKEGRFDAEGFASALTPDTVLVSVMLVNNETGLIDPVPAIADLVHQKAPKAKIHCDAIQGYGKIPFTVQGLKVDMLSASSHKIGGVKGVGFLYVKKGVHLVSPVKGGGHEKGLRSGTVNVPGICAFATAVEETFAKMDENRKKVQALRDYAKKRLSAISSLHFHEVDGNRYSPYILGFSLDGLRGETVQHFLSDKGIYVSTGSACSSHSKGNFRVAEALNLTQEEGFSTLRVSFAPTSSEGDVDALFLALQEAVAQLSKGVRK